MGDISSIALDSELEQQLNIVVQIIKHYPQRLPIALEWLTVSGAPDTQDLADVVETLHRNPDLLHIIGDLLLEDLVRMLRLTPNHITSLYDVLSVGFSPVSIQPLSLQ